MRLKLSRQMQTRPKKNKFEYFTIPGGVFPIRESEDEAFVGI